MSFNIVVCVKQVVDPDTPSAAFKIDQTNLSVKPAEGIPPVVNGYCENAVEAAKERVRKRQLQRTLEKQRKQKLTKRKRKG